MRSPQNRCNEPDARAHVAWQQSESEEIKPIGQCLIIDNDVDVLSQPRLAIQHGGHSTGQVKTNANLLEDLDHLAKRALKGLNRKHRQASDQ